MQINLLKWCDEKISYLKKYGIIFKNGVAVLPEESIYKDIPLMVSTYKYRNDIPEGIKRKSLLTYFMPDEDLWTRLYKLDEDLEILKTFGGITGFDLSPSIGMLRPRQKFSILVNSIVNAYCAINGIKILPNSRIGDFVTLPMIASIPYKSNIITSRLGCQNNGFKAYSLFQTKLIIERIKPSILFVYGSVTQKEAEQLIREYAIKIISFPDRRSRVWNNAKSWCYEKLDENIIKTAME